MADGSEGKSYLVKRISLFARDLREKRDGLEISSSQVAPVAHVLLVSLTIHGQRIPIACPPPYSDDRNLHCAQLSHPPTYWQTLFTRPTLRLHRNRFPGTCH